MPGRLAAEYHTRESRCGSDRFGPVQDVVDHPGIPAEHAPAEHDRIVIGHHRSLLGRRQIHRHDRVIAAHDRPQPNQPLVPTTITTGKGLGTGHESSSVVAR